MDHSHDSPSILISGGHTVQEAKDHQATVPVTDVIEAVPQNHIWQGNWLVAPGQVSGDIWQYVKQVSSHLSTLLEDVLDATFDRKQGVL